MLIVIIVIIVVATKKKDKDDNVSPSSKFVAQKYKKAAVAADAKICSQVGANMLKKNGSAIDAAVATLFCLGVVNLQSCGIGGGGFMVFYQKALKKFTIFDYREVAPLAATKDMFINESSVRGKYFFWFFPINRLAHTNIQIQLLVKLKIFKLFILILILSNVITCIYGACYAKAIHSFQASKWILTLRERGSEFKLYASREI